MHADEKSDKTIVPKKRPNKESSLSAEDVEERVLPKRNTGRATAVRTQSRGTASIDLASVRQAARTRKDVQFTAKVNWVLDADIQRFFHAMNHDWMM